MAITTRASIQTNLAKGLGYIRTAFGPGTGTLTAAAHASGGVSLSMAGTLGTTMPNTIVGYPLPAGLSSNLPLVADFGSLTSGTRSGWIARIYLMGTLDMTIAAPTDGFTPDAATFPVLRTKMGAASQPVTLIPMVQINTATTVAACIFTPKTTANGNGYTNQDGTGVVGAKTWTAPSATTAVSGLYFFKVNEGDSGVQSIIELSVSTASGAGTAQNIWGVEILSVLNSGPNCAIDDAVTSGLRMVDLAPAVATSGTVTSHLVWLGVGAAGSTVQQNALVGVLN